MSRAEQQYHQRVATSRVMLGDYQRREQKALIALVVAGLLLILCCLAGGAVPAQATSAGAASLTGPAAPGF